MRFTWPIDGIGEKPGIIIQQRFAETRIDYSQFGLKGHDGIDISAPRGTPIKAIYDGWIIEQMSKDTGFGLRITQRIEFEGNFYYSVYGHMQRLENPETVPYNWNDKTRFVKQGQVIGYVNSTGFSTGDHLHNSLYDLYENGSKKWPNNGYGGAIDIEKFFIKDQFSLQSYKGELRLLLRMSSQDQLKALSKVFGVNPNEITEKL